MPTIITSTNPTSPKADIQKLQDALSLLGHRIGDFERRAKIYGPDTLRAIKSIQTSNRLAEQDGLAGKLTVNWINAELGAVEEQTFLLDGRVLNELGEVLANTKVKVVAFSPKAFGVYQNAVKLSELSPEAGFKVFDPEIEPDETGFYSTSLTPVADKKQVAAVAFQGEVIMGRSPIVTQSQFGKEGQLADLNILVDSKNFRAEREFVRMTAKLKDIQLQELIGNEGAFDVLALETGIDREVVKAQVEATAIARDLGNDAIFPNFLYGLGRQGIALDLVEMATLSDTVLQDALNRAADEHLIDQADSSTRLRFVEALRTKSNDTFLNAHPEFKKTLAAALPSIAKQRAFLRAAQVYEDKAETFWAKLPQAGFSAAEIKALQLNNQLYLLTDGHALAVEVLQNTQRVQSLSALIEYSQTAWDKWVRQSGRPAGYDSDATYIKAMQSRLYAAFPTQKIAQMVKTDEFALKSAQKAALSEFLAANPDFDITKPNWASLEAQALRNYPLVKEDLMAMQRLYSVSATPDMMTRLWKANLHSAYSIINVPKAYFVKTFQAAGPGVADTTYQRAQFIVEKVQAVAMRLKDEESAPGGNSFIAKTTDANAAEAATVNAAIKKLIPNYEELFGSPVLCECQHCRSMYSPAAYYVDLLRYLDPNVADNGQKPLLPFLLKRRPDLIHLELSCENTNTLIPYLDLANEVMEYYVANASQLNQNEQTNAYKGFNNHNETPNELRAQAQNTRLEAYKILSKAVYPSSLPYHYPLDLNRHFFEAMKSSHYAIMQAFVKEKAFGGGRSRAYLNLAPEEAELLNGSADYEIWEYYGFAPQTTEAAFNSTISGAKEMVLRLGISYQGLSEVLATRYINPGQDMLDFISDTFKNIPAAQLYTWLKAIKEGNDTPLSETAIQQALAARNIRSNDFKQRVLRDFDTLSNVLTLFEESSACNPESTYLYTLKGIYELPNGQKETVTPIEVFAKIQYFLRLQRKYAWKTNDLDALLSALNPSQFIDQLAEAKWLMDTLQLKPMQVAVFWTSMDTRGAGSLYARLFLNRAIAKLDATFEADAWGNYLSSGNHQTINEHRMALLAALKISETDLSAILTDSELGDNAALSLENLSILYRYSLLAKALKITVEELIQIKQIFKKKPFSEWNATSQNFKEASPENTSDFVRLVQRIKGARIPVALLRYLAGENEDSTLALSGEQIGKTIEAIVQSEIDYPVAENATILQQQLGILFEGATIQRLFSILNAYEASNEDETWLGDTFGGFLSESNRSKLVEQPAAGLSSEEAAEKKAALLTRNIKLIAEKYLPHLHKISKSRAAIGHYATLWGLTASQTLSLLGGAIDAVLDLAADEVAIQKYHKAALLIQHVKLNEQEIERFSLDGVEWKNLKLNDWLLLDDYRLLRQALPQQYLSLIELLQLLAHNTFATLLSETTTWRKSIIVEAIGALSTSVFNNITQLKNWQLLLEQGQLAARLQTSIATLKDWAGNKTNFDSLYEMSISVQQVARAMYSDEAWEKNLGVIHNKLRHHQRDALIAHLLQNPLLQSWGIKDADGLFDFFLIDVQMGACMETSRIKQAISSVQAFVNRCLLNLETGISPSDLPDRNQWEWMKNYRVWEANRKVFLYPENWLEPEWRDDRSPFFRDLEGEITQNDITSAGTEQAFRNYVKQLNEVSQLEIVGMYNDGDTGFTHIFGRSHAAPYQYYYRTLNTPAPPFQWSAWDKVQVDIRGTEEGENSGVHLVPIVWKSRLFLFWPEFMAKDKNTSETPQPYWEIRLAWTEYQSGRWAAKQLSKEFVKSEVYTNNLYQYKLVPLINPSSKLLSLSVIIPPADHFTVGYVYPRESFQGAFHLADIQGKIEVSKKGVLNARTYTKKIIKSIGNDVSSVNDPNNSTFKYYDGIVYKIGGYHNFFSGVKRFDSPSLSFSLRLKGHNYLAESPVHTLISSSEIEDFQKKLEQPFFYQDNERTYYVDTDMTSYYVNEPLLVKKADAVKYIAFEQRRIPSTRLVKPKLSTSEYKNPRANQPQAGALAAAVNLQAASAFAPLVQYAAPFSMLDLRVIIPTTGVKKEANSLIFYPFFHPYSGDFITQLNQGGVAQLMEADTDETQFPAKPDPKLLEKSPTASESYAPKLTDGFVSSKSEIKIHFDYSDAYALYNWELFFHAPLYIAIQLSKNGKYAEAMRWFHYIFDPTTSEGDPQSTDSLARYWKVKPFRTASKENLFDYLENINQKAEQVDAWKDNPFKPHLIARSRNIPYMKHVVFKYVENLLAWGDDLFRRDTMESINEALQLYIIAAHLLGRRPEKMPERGRILVQTYSSLRNDLDVLSNALVPMENYFPHSSAILSNGNEQATHLLGLGKAFYFCIPSNEKMLQYWDTLSDRLFKIRHCQNIEGVERRLALFEPPIDPALLINAQNKGLNISQVLDELNSPMPIYRFVYLVQRATELCNEVKSLGGSLLAAIEKRDNEALTRLRSSHEIQLLQLITSMREHAVLEARSNFDGLKISRETAKKRMAYYLELLGVTDKEVPDLPQLAANLTADSALPVDTVMVEERPDVDVSLVEGEAKGVKLINKEKEDFNKTDRANDLQNLASGSDALASLIHLFPDTIIGGFGVKVRWGGFNIANGLSSTSTVLRLFSNVSNSNALKASKMASYIRRDQEWVFQANQAGREIIQIDKQIVAAEIRLRMAEKELAQQRQQIRNAEEVEQFLQTKFSNTELYQWMREQLKVLHRQSYQIAFDMAQKAEKALSFELGRPISVIRYDYWDQGYEGLMAGEKLHFAIRQLEKIQHEENRRELEITKHISLNQLHPLALLQLRETGKCDFAVPEELFDLDFPGHYFRRIKSVSITIPCIAGPYTTVNATLRLKNNSIRINTGGEPYQRKQDEEDERFRDHVVGIQSIATSSAQNDAGLFELNFRDERYLPFEGSGAISEWTLEMMEDKALRQFDYNTIADVIVHLRYTAREDSSLKTVTVSHLKDLTNALGKVPLQRLFSLHYDFPNEWHAWTKQNQALSIQLDKRHFPYFAQMGALNIVAMQAYPQVAGSTDLSSEVDIPIQNGGWELAPGTVLYKEKDEKPVEDWWILLMYELGGL